MRISAIYGDRPIVKRPTASHADAAKTMAVNGISALAVAEGDRLGGIVTEKDLVRAMVDGRNPREAVVADYATRNPEVAHPDDDTGVVAEKMLQLGLRHLPVVVDDRLVGMISARDLLLMEVWQDHSRTIRTDDTH